MSWTPNQEVLGLNPHIRDMLCYHMYFSKTCVYTQEVVGQSQMAEKLLTRIDKLQIKDPCVSISKTVCKLVCFLCCLCPDFSDLFAFTDMPTSNVIV